MATIKSSEQLNEIFSALSKAQALIDNVVSDKQAYNYKYADLGSVIAAIRDPFAKNGLSVIQMPFSMTDKDGIVRDGLSTRICHESGQWIESEMLSPGSGQGKTAIQNIGSNITYMRRYMLAAMAGVTQVDDETKLMNHSNRADGSVNPDREPDPQSQKIGIASKKPKRTFKEGGFEKMLKAIADGRFSKKSVIEAYNLTPNQLAEINAIGGQNAS